MDRNKTARAQPRDAEELDDAPVGTPPIPSADHVSASGDDETVDGLNESDEAVRRGAEDMPSAERRRRPPVFERGEEAPDTD